MKNLKFIILCLFLIQNYIQSSDADIIGYYIDDTSEPNTTIFYDITRNEVPDQELSRKTDPETGRTTIQRLTSNPHYQPKAIPEELDFSDLRFGKLKTRDDHVDPELLEREEKFKKLRQQEKAATKIQAELRSRQAHEKLKKIRETEAARMQQEETARIQQEEADEKNQAELRLKANKLVDDVNRNKSRLTVKIKTLADQSYPKFKELICTSDYLTKTDWIYQFIEAAENKTIFERNSDGTINPEKFTPEFEKEIENPSDWLHEKIIKYLPKFHDLVYEAFVDKAVEQIVKHHSSWTAAVSIPTPKGHGSFQEEGTPLFPKIYKLSDSKENQLILGKIFTKILETDPKKFDELNFENLIKFEYQKQYSSFFEYHKLYSSFFVNIFNRMVFDIDIPYYEINSTDVRSILLQKAKEKNIDQLLLDRFSYYLNNLGLELSPEEEKQLDNFNKKVNKISKAKHKFIEDHINWASSARQTFYLGQLIFDKNLSAFDALGGQEWLEQQPIDMQKYIKNFINVLPPETLNSKPDQLANLKREWKKEERNLLRDLSQV